MYAPVYTLCAVQGLARQMVPQVHTLSCWCQILQLLASGMQVMYSNILKKRTTQVPTSIVGQYEKKICSPGDFGFWVNGIRKKKILILGCFRPTINLLTISGLPLLVTNKVFLLIWFIVLKMTGLRSRFPPKESGSWKYAFDPKI